MSVCVCWGSYVCVWGSEDNLQESLLSFHCVGPGEQTRLSSRYLYQLSHLTSPHHPNTGYLYSPQALAEQVELSGCKYFGYLLSFNPCRNLTVSHDLTHFTD